jgi:hypothetical protein
VLQYRLVVRISYARGSLRINALPQAPIHLRSSIGVSFRARRGACSEGRCNVSRVAFRVDAPTSQAWGAYFSHLRFG